MDRPAGPEPTIADLLLATGDRLEICCAGVGCRRRLFWTPAEAAARLGRDSTMAQAARRLVCGACGARGRERAVQCRPSSEDYGERLWRDRQARDQAATQNAPGRGAEGAVQVGSAGLRSGRSP